MTISKLFFVELIKDDTEITIRDKDYNVLALGNWYEDKILDYSDSEIESFTWQDDNNVYIDVK